jgi:hypothetical protein
MVGVTSQQRRQSGERGAPIDRWRTNRHCLLLAGALAAVTGVSQASAQAITRSTSTSTATFTCSVGGVTVPCANPAAQVTTASAVAVGANTGDLAASVANAGIEDDIDDLRKRKQKRLKRRRLGYADELGAPWQNSNAPSNLPFGAASARFGTPFGASPAAPFSALAYAPGSSRAMYTKAEPLDSDVEREWWTTGTFEYENQAGTFNGADIGTRTLSGAAHVGVDYTWTLAGDENYFTLGAFGGLTQTFLSAPTGATATTTAPNAGAYLMYFLGNSRPI